MSIVTCLFFISINNKLHFTTYTSQCYIVTTMTVECSFIENLSVSLESLINKIISSTMYSSFHFNVFIIV